jgi:putative transposase
LIVKRRSVRLQGHDYSSVNVYFITICSYQKECFFGEIRDGIMDLNDFGLVIRKSWLDTEALRSNVLLGEFVIMPNHFHGLIWITGECTARDRGTARRAPTTEQFGKPVHGSLPTIVRSFKAAAIKRINELRGSAGVPVWQRNYYEHMVCDYADLSRIEGYIRNNPTNWNTDEENPNLKVMGQDPL